MAMRFLNLQIISVGTLESYQIARTLTDCLGVRIEYLPPYSLDLNPIEEPF